MRRKQSTNNQGTRSNMYSESKFTNWARFDPIGSAIEKFYFKHSEELEKCPKEPAYFKEKLHSEFLMPVTIYELKTQFQKIPQEFTSGIRGIFLLGGSRKQLKACWSKLFCFGTYWLDCIFILPYPKERMEINFKTSPSPHILNDYKRVGAKVTNSTKGGVTVSYSEENLKAFYLRDVFVHEIGHHVDKSFSKHRNKKEGFAEWFATEYGFKFKFYSDE